MYKEDYFEVCVTDGEKCSVTEHDTIEEAIEHANEYLESGHEPEEVEINEVGGYWREFRCCWFCREWFEKSELNEGGVCVWCDVAIRDHEAH